MASDYGIASSLSEIGPMLNSTERFLAETPYAVPREVASLDECYFYHTMDVPGHGTVKGEWDLRGVIGPYLGNFDFAGKRVLDVGAASGILSFHIEQQGTDVVSFDLSDDFDWDIVPFKVNDHAASRLERRAHLRRYQQWLLALPQGVWFAGADGERCRL